MVHYRTLAGVALLGLLAVSRADAVMLEVQPASDSVIVGDLITVDVVVDPMGVLVGAFDIVLGYDAAILAVDSLQVDPQGALGGGPLVATQDLGGAFNAAALSLEFDLAPFQDGTSFTLFSLTFAAVAVGNSALTLSPGVLGISEFLSDELGNALDVQEVFGGNVEVLPSQVSEPGVLLLVLSGLLALPLFAGGRRRSHS